MLCSRYCRSNQAISNLKSEVSNLRPDDLLNCRLTGLHVTTKQKRSNLKRQVRSLYHGRFSAHSHTSAGDVF